jgi:hypothetical protein
MLKAMRGFAKRSKGRQENSASAVGFSKNPLPIWPQFPFL